MYDPNANYATDYTAYPTGGATGNAASADDFEIADVVAVNKTADQVVAENKIPDVPAGPQRLIVLGFLAAPEPKYFTVLVDGKEQGYNTHAVNVKLGWCQNTKANLLEYLVLPPPDPNHLRAYYEGVDKSKPDGQKGFAASKFFHFISAIGFDYLPGQPLPEQAKKLGNWKGREVIGNVKPGTGTRTDQNGKVWDNRAQVKLFGYQRVVPTIGGIPANALRQPPPSNGNVNPIPTPNPPAAAPNPATPSPGYASPEARRAAVNLADI